MANDSGRDPLGQALAVPVEPVARLDPSGFDPSRWAALRDRGSWPFFANAEPICPHCGELCSITANEWWHLYSEDGPHAVECPSCERGFEVSSRANWSFSTDDQEAMIEEDAIATEARRAETENTGSVHEGAGPQDIAQPRSVSGLSHTGGDRG